MLLLLLLELPQHRERIIVAVSFTRTRASRRRRRRRSSRRLLLLLGLPLLRLGLLRLRPLLRGQLAQEPKPNVGLVGHPEPAALLDATLKSRHVPSTCHDQHKVSVSQELQETPVSQKPRTATFNTCGGPDGRVLFAWLRPYRWLRTWRR